VACHQVQTNQGDSQLLVVGSQIGNLIPGLSFGHNLCLKYPNGSCEPILNIFISIDFQWCKGHFNPMIFEPYNRPLKIKESIETLILKAGAHLGVCGFIPSHFSTLPGSMKCDSWASLLAYTFASPCFGHKPKVRVATMWI